MKNMENLKCVSRRQIVEKGKPYAPWYDEAETMLDTAGSVPLLRFRSFETPQAAWMDLAFTTKQGGVSKGYLQSLNLGWDRGDDRANVCENYKRACRAFGTDYRRLVLSDQVHDTKILYVDENYAAGEAVEKKVKGVDGLVTDVAGLTLATSYADCVPLFLMDPVKRIIASSHSGWRGTVAGIGEKTVRYMEQMGSRAKDLVVLVGPSICQDCYEVSEDVAEQFRAAYTNEQCEKILEKGRWFEGQRYQLDLWSANWYQFMEAGILPENIHIAGICTCCNAEILFSHRATGGRRGNLNGLMTIRTSY